MLVGRSIPERQVHVSRTCAEATPIVSHRFVVDEHRSDPASLGVPHADANGEEVVGHFDDWIPVDVRRADTQHVVPITILDEADPCSLAVGDHKPRTAAAKGRVAIDNVHAKLDGEVAFGLPRRAAHEPHPPAFLLRDRQRVEPLSGPAHRELLPGIPPGWIRPVRSDRAIKLVPSGGRRHASCDEHCTGQGAHHGSPSASVGSLLPRMRAHDDPIVSVRQGQRGKARW